jgi:hypothetical protein
LFSVAFLQMGYGAFPPTPPMRIFCLPWFIPP